MGIPYYFYLLTQKYQNILTFQPTSCDILCLDFNGIIHTVLQSIQHTDFSEDKLMQAIWDKVLDYIAIFKPSKLIICTDGVAPLAKMAQQRRRRYLAIFKNKIDTVSDSPAIWDSNAITTGTVFMTNLNAFMKNKMRYNTSNTQIIYSGSDENGEGEHKIFDKLSIEPREKHIIIHGLDADLIILSLMSHRQNIKLMREQIKDNSTIFQYLDVHNLREAIIRELIHIWPLMHQEYEDIYSQASNDIIESYAVACSILGNDFIPHITTLNIKTDGMEKIVQSAKSAISSYGMLVKDGLINHDCLSHIFVNLAQSEDQDIHHQCERYIKKPFHPNANMKPSDLYVHKNRDVLTQLIYNNPSRWRHEYYKHLFKTNITLCSTVVSQACANFVKGIYWTYAYYKKYDIDHYWHYPYSYAPTMKDIANFCIANAKPAINKTGNYVPSYVQLLIVLPKESMHLLPEKYKKYMSDSSAGLYHMYPKIYKIQTFMKTHLWECCPILPTININYVLKLVG